MNFAPTTVEFCRNWATKDRDFIEYLAKHGNDFERSAAELVLSVGCDV
ncbi:MAG: hypothetical protein PWQ52_581 [Methanolobus sp.]|nr:hypothetical protein [Methanolobus sp.]